MTRKHLWLSGWGVAASLFLVSVVLTPAHWLNRLQAVARAASRAPQTKADFDIRAGLQRTLKDPADAEIVVPFAASSSPTGANAQTKLRRSELPYALRRARPTVQMRWSSLTQAPSRLWSFQDTLSGPSNADAETIARRFLNDNADLLRLDSDDVAALQVARRYQDAHNGLTHLTLQQQLDGIEVFQGELALHIARTGEIVALSGEALPHIETLANARKPHLSAVEALRLAAAEAEVELSDTVSLKVQPQGAAQKQTFDRALGFARDVEAQLVYFPLTHEQVRLAWQFTLWMPETPDVYLTLIDAEKGTLLFRYNFTSYDENPLKPHGPVFTKDSPFYSLPYTTSTPPATPREDVPFHATPFNGTEIFPASDPHYDWWAGKPANNLITNNVDAHLDRDANNQADLPRLEAADGNFNFPLDFTKQPTDADYQKAVQVNLFYWVNRYHDILYQYGFTEAAGNYQTDNFGRGGRAADAIFADAQDGSGTNNANFSAPPDGTAGRVQMYIFTITNPNRDGDLEQGIINHELSHGLSQRLVSNSTGLTGMQAGGMGEGWSDYFGLVLLRDERDDLDGAYPSGQWVLNNYPKGVRRYAYSTNPSVFPLTFKDIRLSTEVHNVGEIWCNALLEMRAALIRQLGFKEGQRQSIQLVVDGLKLTPRSPSFLDARNAILLADRVNNGGANQCLIWQAFAKRGMGFDAFTSDASDGAPDEALASAPYCLTLGSLRTDKPNYLSGETLRINLGDSNAPATISAVVTTTITGDRETIVFTADRNIRGSFDAQLKVASGRARPGDGIVQGAVEAGDEIVVTYNDANTGAGTAVVRLSIPIAREKVIFDDTVEAGNPGWLPGGTWAIINTRAASPARSWTDSPAGNYANGADMSLVSPQFDFTGLNNVTLSFAQSYAIEEGFDFGIIEVSTDDGQTWRRIAANTGTQADFRQAQVRLRGLDNQPRARVRLRFTSDGGVNADGWYVDDLRITGRSVSAAIIPPGLAFDPAIARVEPAFGPPAGGTRVAIYGANFTEAEDTQVTFDGLSATGVVLVSNGVLTAVAPPHAAGAVTVRVTNRNGGAAAASGFTYYTAATTPVRPEIEGVLPDFGSIRGGTTVTVLGKGFTPETTVAFNGRAARVTFVNATTLRAVTPFGEAGRADVTVANSALSHNRPSAFNYVNPTPPTVDVVSPDGGDAIFVGSLLNIRWNSADNRALASHRISLFRPGTLTLQFVSDLAANLSGNTRNFNWTVPNTLANGEYRIRVIATDDEGVETEAYSNGGFTLNRRWETSRALPAPLGQTAVVGDGRFLYTIGGRLISGTIPTIDTVQRLDTNNVAAGWANVAPLPAPISAAEAAFLRGKIYVPGGAGATASTTAHYVYDVATNVWTAAAPVTLAQTNYAATADDARGVYHVTGVSNATYNPATNTWTALPTMLSLRLGHEAALIEGKLYVAGGLGSATPANLTAEVFDFDTRRWTALASPKLPRYTGANFVTQDLSGNPLWVLVGGVDPATASTISPPEVYDVRNNRWTVLDNSFNMPTPRLFLGHAVVNGFAYAIGSNSSLTGALVERFSVVPLNTLPLDPVPPVLVAPETVVAVAGAVVRFEVLANDLGSEAPLTIAAAGLPPNASFSTTVTTNNNTRGTFRWVPAASDAGRNFLLSFTVSDGLASDARLVNLRVVTARPMAAVNAADFRPDVLAPDSIASLFGTDLAVRAAAAEQVPLPFDLNGTTVTVNGAPARLLFVSSGQINFLVPPNTAQGLASIVVSTPNGIYAVATARIVPAVPALFTRDQTGRGEAFALATDGVRFQTPPFDVTTNGRPNVLVLFGTGFRRALAANPSDDDGVAEAVTATIGGQAARVLFAGAQGDFAGLDQINVEFPASLAGGGRRNVDVVLSVNGENANRVTIEIR
ncbi:MAG: M36 family metallopeptidase [Acidobacteria bacterium]|nr:M36 family metallopeptidase [Acidobacteriota bacterium]